MTIHSTDKDHLCAKTTWPHT